MTDSTPSPQLRVAVLGRVAAGDDRGLAILQRHSAALLCLLVAGDGEASQDALVGGLWGSSRPANPVGALHTAISRLRAALTPAGAGSLVATTAVGYRLVIDRAAVDAWAFHDLVVRARSRGSVDEKIADLRSALELWRGPPFDGSVIGTPPLLPSASRLEALHLEAREMFHSAQITSGRAIESVPELRALVAGNPDHEPYWHLLVVALDAEGRRVEARRTFESYRQRMVTEFGFEPSVSFDGLVESTKPAPPG